MSISDDCKALDPGRWLHFKPLLCRELGHRKVGRGTPVLPVPTTLRGRQAIADGRLQSFMMCEVADRCPEAVETPRGACLMGWGVREGFREETTVELGLE